MNNEWVLWFCLVIFMLFLVFIAYMFISLTTDDKPKMPTKGK